MTKTIWQEREIEELGNYIRKECMPEIYKDKCGIFMTSGFYTPTTHSGHLAVIKEMCQKRELFDHNVVVINGDNATKKKYGFTIPAVERATLMSRIHGVDAVCIIDDDNMVRAIQMLCPKYFFKGGDRDSSNMDKAEIQACEEVGCCIIYGAGGFHKRASNSEYIKMIRQSV